MPFATARRMPSTLRLLAAVLLLCARPARGAVAPARDLTALPLEQLVNMEVVSASRFTQKASEAPAIVTVITAADIRNFGWRTLADVARSVRGLNVNYDRNYSYLGERGFQRPGDYNTRILLQIDGMRVNDVVYGQAPLGGEFPLDLELIERIEFVAGPGSSVYGSNAFFGVINVITRHAGAEDGGRVSVAAGQGGYRAGRASAAWTAGAAGYLLSYARATTAGRDLYFPEFDQPGQQDGVARGLDGERVARLYFSVRAGALRAMALHAVRTKGIPTASFAQPFGDGRTHTVDEQSYADLAWSGAAAAGLQLDLHAFGGYYLSNGNYVYTDSATINHDGSQALWWGVEAKLVSTRWAGHKVVAGAEMQRDAKVAQQNFDDVPRQVYLDDRRTASHAGGYLQDEWAVGPAVRLDAGARYDRYRGAAGVLSPRLALIWQGGPDTTVKALYGTAYRMPNSYEKYYQFLGEGGQLANPDLRRERIATTELAVVRQFGPERRLTATVFRNRVDDLITLVFDQAAGYPRFINTGRTTVRGAELEYEQQFEQAGTLRASVSRFRPGAAGAGQPVDALPAGAGAPVDAPRQLAKVNLAVRVGPDWRLGAEAQYVGPRAGVRGPVAGFTVLNVNLLTTTLAPHAEVALGVTNLLDRRYGDPGSFEHRQRAIAQDGRTLVARLSYGF